MDAEAERVATLTGREQQVLALVAQGLSNAEIGGRLYLGAGTVKDHVSAILAKLGVAVACRRRSQRSARACSTRTTAPNGTTRCERHPSMVAADPAARRRSSRRRRGSRRRVPLGQHRRPLTLAVCILGCAALLLRRRWPALAFALTLPAALIANVLAAPVIALFSLSARTRARGLLILAGAALPPGPRPSGGRSSISSSSTRVGPRSPSCTKRPPRRPPILLGQLLQTTEELHARLEEIEATKRHEQELYAQSVLAQERNQLAREMHDVVSHQVSLIAVQAAALQVTAADAAAREGAASIRSLSSTTLEELRSMVMLLRAAGTRSPGLAPQPTIAELPALLASTGMALAVTGAPPEDLGPAAQRAVYRTVQEALTNVRKHAPGSPVAVAFWQDDRACGVTITNGAMTEPALDLPGGVWAERPPRACRDPGGNPRRPPSR